MAYPYIPEKKLYVRRGTHADSFITNLIRMVREGGRLSDAELDSITYYRAFDNTDVGVYTDENGNTSYRQVRITEQAARINTTRTGNYGDLIYQNFNTPGEYREILLDRVYHSASPNTPLYSIWLSSETGNWSVYRENPDQSRFPLNSRNVSASGVIINDGGLERKYTLSGRSFLLEEVSSSLYEQAVEQEYMNGLQPADFSALGLKEIPAAFYNDIYNNIATADEQTLLDTAFVLVTVNGADVYSLDPQGLSDPDKLTIHQLFDNATIGDGIAFNQFPNEKRIVLLSETEYDSIRSYFSDTLFRSSFARLTIPGATEEDPDTYWFIPNSPSNSPELSNLFYLIFRDWEIFPYYRESGGNRILRSSLPAHVPGGWEDIVSSLWQNRDYYSWETLTLTIDMGADALLDVEDGYTLPSGETFPDIAPGVRNLPPGSEAGRVTFIALNSQNRSLIYEGYVPVFNSTRDYDTQDIVVYPEDIFPMEEVDETSNLPDLEGIAFDDFSGGKMGWSYNIWCGYHHFDRNLIGTYVEQDENAEYVIPNYTISVVINRNPDPESGNYNQILISETGVPPDTTEISRNAWIGEISSYSKPDMDEDGNNTNLELMFAPFIEGSIMSPCRKGGDAYYSVPKGSSAFAGGNLSTINRSKSDATDVNGGLSLGPVGVNFSRNNGTSWQYAGLMDLNGDRYPDILVHPQDGGASAQYVTGHEGNFPNSSTVTLPFDRMSQYENLTFGFGATAGGGSTGISVYMSDTAKNIHSSMNQGDGEDGGGVSGGGGVNGTLGQGIQTKGLIDINGDGLPDFLSRSGSGDFSVYLNTGMETDWEPATWTGGMNTDLADWSYSQSDDNLFPMACKSAGLSYNNNGSFGASVSLGVGVVGVNAGFTGNCNKTSFRLEDVNGDGLLDQVGKNADEKFFRVRFNLGDTFSNHTTFLYRPDWDIINIGDLLSSAIGHDLALIGSQMTGLTLSGDSLSVPSSPGIPSTGNEFIDAINPIGVDDVLDYSSGVSINLGANVTFSWTWFLLALVLTPGVNGTYATTTTSLQFRDLNGDGLPDHAMKLPGENFVRVKTNIMGKVGLLHNINLPFGGTISLDYQEQGNTEDMPHRKWVLSHMTQDDGRSGQAPAGTVHTYTTRFEYENGKYHRAKREFLGFQVVRTIFGDSSYIEKIYSIKDVYDKGLVLWETFISSTGSTLKETFNTYDEVIDDGLDNKISQFNALVQQDNRIVDPTGSNDIETQLLFQYSNNGNITRLDDRGSTHHTDDDYHLTIEYASGLNGYRPGYPSAMEVFHGRDLIRKREGDYDGNGNLTNLRLYVTDQDNYEYEFTYDRYGNTTYKINPSGLTTRYTYDGQVHQFLTQIDVYKSSISTGYTSSMTWDYPTQTNLTRTDQNNQTETRTYDSHGRLKEIFSPYDVVGETPAVFFDYPELDAALLYSVTQNKLRFDPYNSQTMTTLTYCDGLGRIIQTAKQGETGYGADRVTGWNVSGSLIFDAKGRTVQEGQNVFVPGSGYPGIQELVRPTTTTYDQLDRVIRKELPDGSKITMEYLFQNNLQLVRTTDPSGNITDNLTDAREKIISIQKRNQSQTILTSAQYHYDALGRLTEALDHQGNPVRITYDMQGNRTSLCSHDTGLTEFLYNDWGLLSRKTDANLRHSGKSIDYYYDEFERLVTIDYPSKQSFEDTVYHYGDPGAPNNTAGRLASITYYAGSTSYEYGALGETTSMTRSIKRQHAAGEIKTATIGFEYDYLGRMETIDFPDEEVLTYQYDTGGQVKSVSGTRGTLTTPYVREIGYDEYGQKIYIQLGNRTETYYTYDENRRWLNSILTKDEDGNELQNISYQFDAVGNILAFDNTSDTYTTSMAYNYDDLYQLTRSAGVHTKHPYGSGSSVTYKNVNEQVFAYDSIGNVISKASQTQVSQGDGLNYALDYKYYSDKPHQPERIGNIWYLYDLNGNVVEEREGGHSTGGWTSGGYHLTIEDSIYKVDYGFGLERTQSQGNEEDVYMRHYSWDEENRLIETVEDDIRVSYCYDPSGQRTVKYIEGGETLYFDSLWSITEDYPDFRQSKHIYVGEIRLATKMTIEDDTGTYYEEANTYYYHTDHLGSAQYITDPDGEVFEHLEYTPHGELWIEELAESSDKIPFRFTGKELDEETGNYYMGARYMDPKRARWLSADPAGSDLLDPNREDFNFLESLNWYVYCDNNPVKYVDPDGLAKKRIGNTQPLDLLDLSRFGNNYDLPKPLRMLLPLKPEALPEVVSKLKEAFPKYQEQFETAYFYKTKKDESGQPKAKSITTQILSIRTEVQEQWAMDYHKQLGKRKPHSGVSHHGPAYGLMQVVTGSSHKPRHIGWEHKVWQESAKNEFESELKKLGFNPKEVIHYNKKD
jgi:RHS repeat-associated protein